MLKNKFQLDNLNCYVVAGSNGAGKSTFAEEFLPHYIKCYNLINADLIAKGLSPFKPENAAIKAGKIVFDQIKAFSKNQQSFVIESTLSGRSYIKIFKELKQLFYKIHIFYLWIPSPDLAINRIADRVSKGGHHVPEIDVKRRFNRTLHNLFKIYQPLADSLLFFDNSGSISKIIFKNIENKSQIYDQELYNQITGAKL